MASTTVSFDIIASDRASSKFDHLSRSVGNSGGALSKFSSIAGHAAKVGAFALAGGAVVAAKGLYEMAEGAVADEAAASKLAQTLKENANATDSQISSVERWITAMGKQFGVADDDLRPAMQRLVEATHDVGKAQDLASLAMDASAAKGKPLVQVSEALMKAYNGNIGALGRLGIKTKDAKGETISFEQATKQMADTFGGAASAHADTLAGKMERLKVQISEAGESIGYKLLPYVADAADWLGDHLPDALDTVEDKAGPVFAAIVDGAGDAVDAVKPAVREIVEAFDHLTDGGSDVADVWNDALLPAIETASDAIAKVVDFIDDLPGPVKTFGAEAAIAAVGISKLSTAMASIKASTFITNMSTAETRTKALGGAAKNAAGAAGVALLFNAMQDTGDEAHSFSHTLGLVAGGAGIGAMFGPIGALVGAGAGGGLAALQAAFSDTEEEAHAARREMMKSAGFEAARQGADDLYDALAGVSSQYAQVADDALKASLYDDKGNLFDDIQRLQDAGLNMDTILDALRGQTGAVKLVREQWGGYRQDLQDTVAEAEARLGDLVAQSTTYSDQISKGLTPTVEPVDPSAIGDASDALEDAKSTLKDFNAEWQVFHKRQQESSQAVNIWKDDIQGATDLLGISRSEFNKFSSALKEKLTTNFPQTSRQAVELINKFKDLQSYHDLKMLIQVPGIQFTHKQIDTLADKLHLVPEKVETLYNLAGVSQAQDEITHTKNALNDLDSSANDVTNYIDIVRRNFGSSPVGNSGNQYGDGNGRMAVGGTTMTPSTFSGPTMSRSTSRSSSPRPIHVTVRLGNREFRDFVAEVANDQIEQDREFARIQGD